MPHSTGRPKPPYGATRTCRGGMSPPAVTRTGPSRSSVSAPRRASEESFARFVPIWMKIDPISAQAKRSGLKVPSLPARAVPTSTGATAAGSVRGRDATSQSRSGLKASRALRELAEVGLSLLAVGVAPLRRPLRHVEEEVGVVRELLDAREAVLGRVEARLEEPEREGGEREHLAAPLHGLLLEALERHRGVHEPHSERLLGVVLAAQEPDLLGLLRSHEVGEQSGAEAAVEAAHARACLAEAGVVGGDRQVAHDVQ